MPGEVKYSSVEVKMHNKEPRAGRFEAANRALVVPLADLDAGMLMLAGGKAANLGELIHAGFPVSGGFCVSTAAYDIASGGAGLEPVLDELAGIQVGDTARLE